MNLVAFLWVDIKVFSVNVLSTLGERVHLHCVELALFRI